MTLDTLIMLAGVFTATLPFLGLPNSWDTALFLIAGVFVVALGIAVRRKLSTRVARTNAQTPGAEHMQRAEHAENHA